MHAGSICRFDKLVMSACVVIQRLTVKIGYYIKKRFLDINYGKIGCMDVITAIISWRPRATYFR